MVDNFAPSAALLSSNLVSRGWYGDAELAQAYETGEAHTASANRPQKNNIFRRFSRFIPSTRRNIASPDRAASTKRRRSWAGSSRLPKDLRAQFTEGERAALSIIAEQHMKHGKCDLPLDKIAALAGVSRTTCQNAFRKASGGPSPSLAIQMRPQSGRKNLTNIIRIISQEWKGWLKNLIGFKRLNPTKNKNNRTTSNDRTDRQQGAYEKNSEQPRNDTQASVGKQAPRTERREHAARNGHAEVQPETCEMGDHFGHKSRRGVVLDFWA